MCQNDIFYRIIDGNALIAVNQMLLSFITSFVIFIQKICIYLFLKAKNLLKFLLFGEVT